MRLQLSVRNPVYQAEVAQQTWKQLRPETCCRARHRLHHQRRVYRCCDRRRIQRAARRQHSQRGVQHFVGCLGVLVTTNEGEHLCRVAKMPGGYTVTFSCRVIGKAALDQKFEWEPDIPKFNRSSRKWHEFRDAYNLARRDFFAEVARARTHKRGHWPNVHLAANRTRRDSGNDANDPKPSFFTSARLSLPTSFVMTMQ